jgi:hypothetical protein
VKERKKASRTRRGPSGLFESKTDRVPFPLSHAFGIAPYTMVRNHLNQPRELVLAHPVTSLFA